jgi:hypothetical protein
VLKCDIEQLQLACVWMFYRYTLSLRPEHLIVSSTAHRRQKIEEVLRKERSPFRCGLEVAIVHRSDAFGQCVIASPRRYGQEGRDFFAFDVPGFVVAVSDGFLPKSYRPYKLKSGNTALVASFPLPEDEVAEAITAINGAGGLEAIDEFFESPRGKL